MRTARSLTVSPNMLCSRGGGGLLPLRCLLQGGIPACTEVDPPLWTEFLTHAYENITLPQTSFAGGKNKDDDECEGKTGADPGFPRRGR